MPYQILVREVKPPAKGSRADDIKWLCSSLGLSTNRDIEGSVGKILELILNAMAEDRLVTSTEISDHMRLTRGAVLHHLRKLEEAGLLARKERGYVLRGSDLEDAVESMRNDMERMIERVKRIASEIDDEFGIEGRW